MTKTVELDVAQATLSELIAGLKQDDDVVIVQNQKTVARIIPPKRGTPKFGSCEGMLTIISDEDEYFKDLELMRVVSSDEAFDAYPIAAFYTIYGMM